MKRLSHVFLTLLFLAPAAHAESLSGMYQVDARYGAVFTSCSDGQRYDIAEDNASLKLEGFYDNAKIPRGMPVFLRLEGDIENRDEIPTLVIDSVRDLSTKENCATTIPTTSLENTLWKLERIGFREMKHSHATLSLLSAEHSASGNAGCNRYKTNYTIDGSQITFTPATMTRMACVDGSMDDEQHFVDALTASTQWELAGDHLALMNSRGETLLEFSAEYLQ